MSNDLDTRAEWGARAPKSTEYLGSTKGVKAHYTGGRVDPDTLTDHARCRAAIRGIQNGHMDGNGWADIGYSMWVCEHAYGIGRGPHVLPAANGAGLNSGHYAILVLVGNAGVTEMTDAMKTHFHEARNYLRDKGNAGTEIKGHRDGYATDCPGPDIYAWVRAGAPRPGGSSTPPPSKPSTPSKPANDWTENLIMSLPTLERGATGAAVRRLQGLLVAAGSKDSAIDGDFGPQTEEAVRREQARARIDVDGIVGRQTWTKLLGA